MRNQMERRALGTAIVRCDAKEKDVLSLFGDVDEDVEISTIVEDAGVDELELGIVRAAPAVFVDEL